MSNRNHNTFLSLLICIIALILFSSCGKKEIIYPEKLITEKTTQYFIDEKVPDALVENIIKAGQNTTSAMNRQNWHFTAVSGEVMMEDFRTKIQESMPENIKEQTNRKAQLGDSPLAIIVSCIEGCEYDAGLATQNMFAYTVMNGYGAKIVSSPAKMLNDNYKEKLEIPSEMSVVSVILIGKPKEVEGIDSVTSASKRKNINDVANYIER